MKKILIIDDEKDFCNLTKKYLEGIGDYQIIIAMDGEEGMQLIHKHKPDLILLDIVMPKMSGFDVLKALKEKEETMLIPVIMFTIKDEDRYEIEARSLYAKDYITKPIDTETLISKVENALSKSEKGET